MRVEKALSLGSRIVQQLNNQNADKLQNHLAYVTGQARVRGSVTDPLTGVTAPVLRLVRNVQMFQWQEQESGTSNASRVRHYDYYKAWSGTPVVSRSFHHSYGHENPSFTILNQAFEADCTVGGQMVPGQLLNKVPAVVPLNPIPYSLNLYRLAEFTRAPCHRYNDEIYVGQNPPLPQVGDLRISYNVTPVGSLSIVAAEHGNSFTPYVVSDGDEAVYLIEFGKVPVERMFKDALNDNQLRLWGMRLLWWVVDWLGMVLLFYPIKAFTDAIPFLGQLAGFVIVVLCAAGAFFVNGIIIVAAWVYFRPLFAAVIFAVMLLVGASALSVLRPRDESVR